MLSPLSLPSKSPNLGVVLGIPNIDSVLILRFKESIIGAQTAFSDYSPSTLQNASMFSIQEMTEYHHM